MWWAFLSKVSASPGTVKFSITFAPSPRMSSTARLNRFTISWSGFCVGLVSTPLSTPMVLPCSETNNKHHPHIVVCFSPQTSLAHVPSLPHQEIDHSAPLNTTAKPDQRRHHRRRQSWFEAERDIRLESVHGCTYIAKARTLGDIVLNYKCREQKNRCACPVHKTIRGRSSLRVHVLLPQSSFDLLFALQARVKDPP
jgi:hypothetical protein